MPVIEVEHLHKSYGSTVAVDDVSLEVESGEIFGILGPNGAGRTTTVECIEGLRRPDRGRVRVLGLDPQNDRGELRQQVGVQLQSCELPDKIRVGEAVALYASFYRRPADGAPMTARAERLDRLRGRPHARTSTGLRSAAYSRHDATRYAR